MFEIVLGLSICLILFYSYGFSFVFGSLASLEIFSVKRSTPRFPEKIVETLQSSQSLSFLVSKIFCMECSLFPLQFCLDLSPDGIFQK